MDTNCSGDSRYGRCQCMHTCLKARGKCQGWALRPAVNHTPIAPPQATLQASPARESGAQIMNNTDLSGPSFPAGDFPLKRGTTIAEGIAACRSFCLAHQSTCGGWVFVSDTFDRGSHWNGPRCSIKGIGLCKAVHNRTGLYSGTIAGHCSHLSPPPPPGPPPSPPLDGATCHLLSKVTGAREALGVLSGVAGGQPALQTSTLRIAKFEKTVSLRAYVDANFAEAFFQNGRVAMTASCWQPEPQHTSAFASCDMETANALVFASSPVKLVSARVWSVGSIWVSPKTILETPRIDIDH